MIGEARGACRRLVLALCCCALAVAVRAQQQQLPEDPEDDKRFGLWLDQGLSAALWTHKSLEIEFYERFDEGASNLYEYFVQGGVAFRFRRWLMVLPIYRYQRYPVSTTAYENRILLNLTLSRSHYGLWSSCKVATPLGRVDLGAAARGHSYSGLDAPALSKFASSR